MKQSKLIITISKYTKKGWIKNGIKKEKILVFPSGVDIKKFDFINKSKKILRTALNLPLEKKIILYSGQLHIWKGVEIFIQASEYVAKNIQFIILGGLSQDIQFYRTKYKESKNIIFLGNKTYKEVPKYLKASDVLVLPNTAKKKISSLHTSPIKLFEYMAAKIPIVASDLPSIKQIISNKEVIFFEPDNPKELGKKITELLKNYSLALEKTKKAYKIAKKFSWKNRATKILKHL